MARAANTIDILVIIKKGAADSRKQVGPWSDLPGQEVAIYRAGCYF